MTGGQAKKTKMTLGPLVYHWSAEKRRDFYYRIADEAPVDDVYLGELVCAKRTTFFEPYEEAVVERLQRAGKNVIWSSLALAASSQEIRAVQAMVQEKRMIEANDLAVVHLLAGQPFILGPLVTVLNEGSLAYMARCGARRVVFASELTGSAMMALAARFPDLETEAQVFGRQPLAIAMRCYHARAAGRDKRHCRFACGKDEDGLVVKTLAGQPIWTVSGTHTLSAGVLTLAQEALDLEQGGVTHVRVSPLNGDMVRVCRLYRDLLDRRLAPQALVEEMRALFPESALINGFYHEKEGCSALQPCSACG